MSCCGGNCGCGSSCKCGNGCGGCKMYPDMETINATDSLVVIGGMSPVNKYFDGGEIEVAGENGGCKCGPNCTCNPCTCK